MPNSRQDQQDRRQQDRRDQQDQHRPVVWVIDDRAAVAESVCTLLDVYHLSCTAFVDGSMAMAQLDVGDRPALMILDLLMPGIVDGNRVLEHVTATPDCNFPVIILTGNEERLDNRLKGRVNLVLSKTVDPAFLVQHVLTLLNISLSPERGT